MYTRLNRAHRALPVLLGIVTLAGVGVLLVWDVVPGLFPGRAHDALAAFPLTMIAISYLVYNTAHRPRALEFVKAILLAVAFLFWAANQFWPDSPRATLYNDLAIALFVLDVFLVIIGWPAGSPDESFGETYAETEHLD
jgi:predicted membrane protein